MMQLHPELQHEYVNIGSFTTYRSMTFQAYSSNNANHPLVLLDRRSQLYKRTSSHTTFVGFWSGCGIRYRCWVMLMFGERHNSYGCSLEWSQQASKGITIALIMNTQASVSLTSSWSVRFDGDFPPSRPENVLFRSKAVDSDTVIIVFGMYVFLVRLVSYSDR
ncbi:hypothetical protein JOM56_002958 [Amanita muscaria]